MQSAVPLESTGAVLAGRYRVEQLLGRGGMAAVYRVFDERTGRSLALKRGWSADARKLARCANLLEREYHMLAQLAHPRIIEVYDYGRDERGAYYTMELLDGADLQRSDPQRCVSQPWQQACAILADVASSLAILHSRGLVHRDVSARNVRRTADGRAKLIDFGALVSMGVAKEVVGTPPFMAPEVLQMQALDARADLFSLGALGYLLLTGRHAFEARRLSDLRDAWRSRPYPPSRLAPQIPPALDALVLQLLTLDRNGRPRSAGEVMERLSAIAGLPHEATLEVSRAYLATPILVGRDRALVRVRRNMLGLVRGDGGTLVVRGAAGSGRSRLLDGCALEAKLLAATVVRADASAGQQHEWAVARALGAQLLELLPEQSLQAARLARATLGCVIDGLRDEAPPRSAGAVQAPPRSAGAVQEYQGDESLPLPERSVLVRELRDFVLQLARSARLVLVIDDADRIDEPSAALIAALAHKTERHAVLLVVATDSEAESGAQAGPLALLDEIATRIDVEPLQPEQTEALVRSLFGDVAYLPQCAARIHELSQGSPRVAMELAQHLVDRGLARYEAGSWTLPADLGAHDLPANLAASLLARVERVSADARELCDALALADANQVPTESYLELTSHRDPRRMFKALDELASARILVGDAERHYFAQRGIQVVLDEAMPAARRASSHARLAELLASSGGDVVRRGHHLFGAGRDLEAIALLRSINLVERLPPLPLLVTLVERAERLALPPRVLQELRIALLSKASVVGAATPFRRWVPLVMKQLERDSGLTRYHELAHVAHDQRLQRALAETHARHDALPEAERVHSVEEAIRELARLSGSVTSMANPLYDLQLLEALPSLTPLLPLSPALAVVDRLIQASREVVSGTGYRGHDVYRAVLARIMQPDHGGLDDAQFERTWLGVEYGLGTLEASCGAAVEPRAAVLDGVRELKVNAWRVRSVMHLHQGNLDEARKCSRRAELLRLQEGIEERYAASTMASEVLGHALLGDLLGIKSKLDALETLAAERPGWRPIACYGLGRYRELQGDLDGALEAVRNGLALVEPTRHAFFCHLAAAQVDLLLAAGRTEEAVSAARAHIASADQARHLLTKHSLYVSAALALAKAGERGEALLLIATAIEAAEGFGSAGFALGRIYEARAKIALLLGEPADFEVYVERCAREYEKAHNPMLGARLAALVEQGRRSFAGPSEPPAAVARLLHQPDPPSAYDSVHSRMLECVDEADRGRCALTLLLQSTECSAGGLFLVSGGAVRMLACLPDASLDPGLDSWLERYLEAERRGCVTQSVAEDADTDELDDTTAYVDREGRRFEASALVAPRDGEQRIVALLAFQVGTGLRMRPPQQLCQEIALSLLEEG